MNANERKLIVIGTARLVWLFNCLWLYTLMIFLSELAASSYGMQISKVGDSWIPAFAGMTMIDVIPESSEASQDEV